MKKGIIISSIIVCIIIAIFVFTKSNESVEAVKIQKQNLTYSFVEDGKVNCSNKEIIYSKVTATVAEVYAKNNDYVKVGDKLVDLDQEDINSEKKIISSKYTSLLNQTNTQQTVVETARTQYEYDKNQLVKGQELYAGGGISRQELENLEKMAQDSLKALEVAKKTQDYYYSLAKEVKTERDILNNDIDKYTISSKIEGIVANNKLEKGMNINYFDELMTIYDESTKEIETYIKTENSNLIAEGDTAKIKIKKVTGDEEIDAVIKQIGKTAEETTSTLGLKEYRVKVLLDVNEEDNSKLGVGYNVDVTFNMKEIVDTLAINKTAVFSINGQKYVWILKNDKLVKKEIVEKVKTQNLVQVEGLSEGDIVIKDANDENLIEGKKYRANFVK